MDTQPVFNENKAVTHMCSDFSKSEDEFSLTMRQAAKEAFENSLSNYKTMQGTVCVYVNKRKCSVQETVYHVLPELHLRKILPGVCFANSNILEDRIRILKSERELNMLTALMFLNETMLIVISIDQINFLSWNLSSVLF